MKLVNCEDVVSIAHNYHSEFDMALADLNDLKEVLYDTPTIEAKPIVHAHWEEDSDFDFEEEIDLWFHYCSKCKIPLYGDIEKFRYCPYCGAQMDEKVFTAENPVVVEKIITDPPVATEEEKEKYLNKEIDYIKSYRIEEEHKYD